jgi:hypothetical protein
VHGTSWTDVCAEFRPYCSKPRILSHFNPHILVIRFYLAAAICPIIHIRHHPPTIALKIVSGGSRPSIIDGDGVAGV